MKCPFCMEEIADNSENCSLCKSELVKPCPFCVEKIQADALKCKHCNSMLSCCGGTSQQQIQPPITPQQQIQQQVPPVHHNFGPEAVLPPGIAGWSWGAFLLNWIWAIGNKTWIGLLALVPYVGVIMAIVLGFKGREWAWKNKQWESVEHFNRIQKKWSYWGVMVILIVAGVGIAAIAIPQYYAYKARVEEQKLVSSGNISTDNNVQGILPVQESTKHIIRVVTDYANNITCGDVKVDPTKIVTLVPHTSIENQWDAKYAVLWIGDIGCSGGNSSSSQNISIVNVGSGSSYVVDPLQSSPAIQFESPVKYVERIVGNTRDSLILEGKQYGPDDPNCCPSINIRFTLRLDEKGNWKVAEKES